MKKETRPWIRKAEGDLKVARRLVEEDESLHDAVCFHSQQCAEKYLKALLVEQGHSVPKIHNLRDLLVRLTLHYPTLAILRRALIRLNEYAVDTRYPGFFATKRHAASALRLAERVRVECRKLLGFRS